jgi:hypothetical protein
MNMKDAVTAAKQHISDVFAADTPQNIRLEGFIYDDHLMVWSLTIGFAPSGPAQEGERRISKVVRVSEANKSVLSVRDAYVERAHLRSGPSAQPQIVMAGLVPAIQRHRLSATLWSASNGCPEQVRA